MTIWYDVSDISTWSRNHLTGIQRTVVGILGGLLEINVPLRLVRFNVNSTEWEIVDIEQLPDNVKSFLSIDSQRPTSQKQKFNPQEEYSNKQKSLKQKFLGSSHQTTELKEAFRNLKSSSSQFRKAFRSWKKTRFGKRKRRKHSCRTRPRPKQPIPRATIFHSGDILLSLGATWGFPNFSESLEQVRASGVCVKRMIYDLIPAIKPQWVTPNCMNCFVQWARDLLSGSDTVFTISDFSRNEINNYCKETPTIKVPEIRVLRLGDVLNSSFRDTAPRPRFIPTRPFFLCVSTLDVRKNHRLLYDAWSILAQQDPLKCPDLICIGVPHLYVNTLLREIRYDRLVNRRIHILNNIPDIELSWYYQHCKATIYPSRYEGWGLPVAESLGLGKICLASNATSIPEISKDGPEFFDPMDAHQVAKLIQRVLEDQEWVEGKEKNIRACFKSTEWSQTAQQITQSFPKALV